MIDSNTNSIALTIKDVDLQKLRDTRPNPGWRATPPWHTPQVKPLPPGSGQDKLASKMSMTILHQNRPTGTIFNKIPNNLVNGRPIFVNGGVETANPNDNHHLVGRPRSSTLKAAALLEAAEDGEETLAQVLLDAGVEPTTPLHYCMFFSSNGFWYIRQVMQASDKIRIASLTGADLSEEIAEDLTHQTSCYSVNANIVEGWNNFKIMWDGGWIPISVNVQINPPNPEDEAKSAGDNFSLALAGVGEPDYLSMMDVVALRQHVINRGISVDEIRPAGELVGEYGDMEVTELCDELEKRKISPKGKGKKAELMEQLAMALEENERMALMYLTMAYGPEPEPEPEPNRGGGARFPKSKRGRKSKKSKKSKRYKKSKKSKRYKKSKKSKRRKKKRRRS